MTTSGDREVEVRLADGRTGVIPRADFDSVSEPVHGEVVRAAVLLRDEPRGRVPMSAAWAHKADAWHRIEAARDRGTTLGGRVTTSVKGGFVVDLGVRAFLPRSLVGADPAGGAALVGSDVEVIVDEADRATDRIVVSRIAAQRRARRAAEKAAWAGLQPGHRRRGTVAAVQDYGAKVDLHPLQGLVHRSELSWSHFDHPRDVVSVGDEVDVLVLDVSRSKRRIGLSIRLCSPHPLDAVEVGALVTATVQRVVDFGAFVRLEGSGAEGLLHVSEISPVPGQRADQLVVPGEQLQVKVLSVDKERNRMALSVLAAMDPD